MWVGAGKIDRHVMGPRPHRRSVVSRGGRPERCPTTRVPHTARRRISAGGAMGRRHHNGALLDPASGGGRSSAAGAPANSPSTCRATAPVALRGLARMVGRRWSVGSPSGRAGPWSSGTDTRSVRDVPGNAGPPWPCSPALPSPPPWPANAPRCTGGEELTPLACTMSGACRSRYPVGRPRPGPTPPPDTPATRRQVRARFNRHRRRTIQ